MTSTRHAVVALVLPFGLGAAILGNTGRPAIALPAFVLLVAFIVFELVAWSGRQRVAARRSYEAQRRASGRLVNYTGDEDRLYADLERRRLAG